MGFRHLAWEIKKHGCKRNLSNSCWAFKTRSRHWICSSGPSKKQQNVEKQCKAKAANSSPTKAREPKPDSHRRPEGASPNCFTWFAPLTVGKDAKINQKAILGRFFSPCCLVVQKINCSKDRMCFVFSFLVVFWMLFSCCFCSTCFGGGFLG